MIKKYDKNHFIGFVNSIVGIRRRMGIGIKFGMGVGTNLEINWNENRNYLTRLGIGVHSR